MFIDENPKNKGRRLPNANLQAHDARTFEDEESENGTKKGAKNRTRNQDDERGSLLIRPGVTPNVHDFGAWYREDVDT